jgi:hypothetical protein
MRDSRMERGLDCKGMIYGLKFQFLDGGNGCSSSVWSRIVMEKEDAFGQKSAMTTVNCRLRFLFQHGAVPYTVDCFSFLLIEFKNWSIHISEQCQQKFSRRGCQLEIFLDRRGCVSPLHGLSFGFLFIIMNPGFIPRDNACKKLFTLSMVTCQESSATLHTLQLVFISYLSWHPSGTQWYLRVSWMMPCADPALMFKIVAVVSTEIRPFSPISASTWATFASLTAVHGQPERCSSTTDVQPSWNLSTHTYTFLSLIQLPPYCWIILMWIFVSSLLLTTKILVQNAAPLWCIFLVGAAVILALLFKSRFFCHRLRTARTCPVDATVCCSSFIRLCPILLNIQLICPYLLKPPPHSMLIFRLWFRC